VALLDKVPNGVGVFQNVSRCETLVCLRQRSEPPTTDYTTRHVEEGEVLLCLDNLAQLSPLCLGRIDTGGVLQRVSSTAECFM
jgi:hypothetical protein